MERHIADDGKQFDDELKCIDYEWKLNHKNLATIEFFDKDGNAVTDLMSEAEYWKVTRVNVYNEESIQELKDYIDYIGFCSYADITEPGIWIWGNKDEINQGFVKVADV